MTSRCTAVAGSGISLGDFGAMSADVTLSSARMYDERQSGQSYRVRYAKSLLSTGTSVDLTAYRYSTRHYYNFADFNNSGYQLSEGQVSWALARQRSDFQVRVTQQLGTSVAVVRAPGAAGVSVMNGGVRTDSRGYAVVPYLSPYQNNTVSPSPSTLPEDVDLPQSSTNVYPTKGAVVAATFTPRTGYQALITLTLAGIPAPFGTLVTQVGEDAEVNSGIVGDAGQVYLSGLPEQGKLRAAWGRGAAQQCLAHFSLSKAEVSANNPVRMLNVQCEEGQ